MDFNTTLLNDATKIIAATNGSTNNVPNEVSTASIFVNEPQSNLEIPNISSNNTDKNKESSNPKSIGVGSLLLNDQSIPASKSNQSPDGVKHYASDHTLVNNSNKNNKKNKLLHQSSEHALVANKNPKKIS